MREEEKEVDHRKNNAKGNKRDSKKSSKAKSDAEKNAESLDVDFNVRQLPVMYYLAMYTLSNIACCLLQRKLKGDAKRREATSKSKSSKVSKKRESSSSDENVGVTSNVSKKQRSSKSYSKVCALKSNSSSNAVPAATKSRPEPAIKTKDKKDSHRRKSTGSVRFDSSVNKPVRSIMTLPQIVSSNNLVLTLSVLQCFRNLIYSHLHLTLPKRIRRKRRSPSRHQTPAVHKHRESARLKVLVADARRIPQRPENQRNLLFPWVTLAMMAASSKLYDLICLREAG